MEGDNNQQPTILIGGSQVGSSRAQGTSGGNSGIRGPINVGYMSMPVSLSAATIEKVGWPLAIVY